MTRSTVLFLNGQSRRMDIRVIGGGCLNGQSTAYTVRHGERVWLVPGESVMFVESDHPADTAARFRRGQVK